MRGINNFCIDLMPGLPYTAGDLKTFFTKLHNQLRASKTSLGKSIKNPGQKFEFQSGMIDHDYVIYLRMFTRN